MSELGTATGAGTTRTTRATCRGCRNRRAAAVADAGTGHVTLPAANPTTTAPTRTVRGDTGPLILSNSSSLFWWENYSNFMQMQQAARQSGLHLRTGRLAGSVEGDPATTRIGRVHGQHNRFIRRPAGHGAEGHHHARAIWRSAGEPLAGILQQRRE